MVFFQKVIFFIPLCCIFLCLSSSSVSFYFLNFSITICVTNLNLRSIRYNMLIVSCKHVADDTARRHWLCSKYCYTCMLVISVCVCGWMDSCPKVGWIFNIRESRCKPRRYYSGFLRWRWSEAVCRCLFWMNCNYGY